MKSDYIEYDKAINTGKKLLKEKGSKSILGLYIIAAANTGLRCGDLLELKWNDIIGKDKLQLIEGKTKKPRTITINETILSAFKELYNDRDRLINDYVFKSQKGGVYSIQQLNRALKNVFSLESKKHNISTHSLRKTFGRRVYDKYNESEKALVYLSELFSHSSISVTRVYLGLREEELQNIYLDIT